MQEMGKASTRREIHFALPDIAHQVGNRTLLFIRDLFIQDRIFIVEQFNVSIPKRSWFFRHRLNHHLVG
jgi:hypothetical protein